MLNKAKEDEHIKRMGIGTEAFSEVKNIHESAEVEVARMRAERKLLLESYKPYFILLGGVIMVLWFINGMNNL